MLVPADTVTGRSVWGRSVRHGIDDQGARRWKHHLDHLEELAGGGRRTYTLDNRLLDTW